MGDMDKKIKVTIEDYKNKEDFKIADEETVKAYYELFKDDINKALECYKIFGAETTKNSKAVLNVFNALPKGVNADCYKKWFMHFGNREADVINKILDKIVNRMRITREKATEKINWYDTMVSEKKWKPELAE